MDQTPNLLLPYIMAAQAQKHVTHNEAIRRLDAIVQLAVLDRDLATPPASPVEGARYIVAASPTGAWTGQTNAIAAYQDGAWAFFAPLEGWIAWIADEDVLVGWSGSAWAAVTGLTSVNPTPLVGVNATADATNKLSVSSSAVLFNHTGNGVQVKLNKAAATDNASFLFQTGFSGRAEIGLAGNDDFSFKVSPNGSTFNTAILIDKTTGSVSFPNSSIGGAVPDGDKGDVTVTASGATWTVDANTISNAKLSDVPTATLKGRVTAATGDPEDLTAAQARTLLGLAAIATSGSAADLAAGILPAARFDDTAHGTRAGGTLHAAATGSVAGFMAAADKSKLDGVAASANNYVHPNHSGDVTSVADGATTIAANAVTNAKAAQMAANTFKANNTGATANAADITAAQAKTLLAIASSDVSGLGTLATQSGTFSGTHSGSSSNTNTGDQTITLTGDVTGTGTGSFAAALATVNGNVGSFGLAASVAQFTVNAKGLITAAVNVAIAIASTAITDATAAGRAFLTAPNVAAQTALLDVASASGVGSKKGLVPDPGVTAGTTRFLREDMQFAIPGGGAGGTGASAIAVVDFGVSPGTDVASVTVSGQVSLSGSSPILASIIANSTADHSTDEHIVEEIDVRAVNTGSTTSFVITARTRNKPLTGLWNVAWSWR